MQGALNKDLCTETIKGWFGPFLAQYVKGYSHARCLQSLHHWSQRDCASVISTLSIYLLSLQAQETKIQEVVLQTNSSGPETGEMNTNTTPNNGNVTADLLGLSEQNNVSFIYSILLLRCANIVLLKLDEKRLNTWSYICSDGL